MLSGTYDKKIETYGQNSRFNQELREIKKKYSDKNIDFTDSKNMSFSPTWAEAPLCDYLPI